MVHLSSWFLEIVVKKKNNIFTEEEFDALCKYAVEYTKKSIKKLQSGYIASSPLKGKCNLCEFNKICKSAFDEFAERLENYDVTNEIFLELINNE